MIHPLVCQTCVAVASCGELFVVNLCVFFVFCMFFVSVEEIQISIGYSSIFKCMLLVSVGELVLFV